MVQTRFLFFAANTHDSSGRGHGPAHWFTVAWSIRRKAAPAGPPQPPAVSVQGPRVRHCSRLALAPGALEVAFNISENAGGEVRFEVQLALRLRMLQEYPPLQQLLVRRLGASPALAAEQDFWSRASRSQACQDGEYGYGSELAAREDAAYGFDWPFPEDFAFADHMAKAFGGLRPMCDGSVVGEG